MREGINKEVISESCQLGTNLLGDCSSLLDMMFEPYLIYLGPDLITSNNSKHHEVSPILHYSPSLVFPILSHQLNSPPSEYSFPLGWSPSHNSYHVIPP